jgi:polysaccharide deacetylase 2 family uncharacterized protein YibQ
VTEEDIAKNRLIRNTRQVERKATIRVNTKAMSPREQIAHFARDFGVLDRLVRITDRKDFIEVNLPVNRNVVDLYYTNFQLTRFLNEHNWKQVSGVESANQAVQTLTFTNRKDNNQYRFRIFYDATNAYPMVKPSMVIIVKGFGNLSPSELEKWLNIEYDILYSVIPSNRFSRANMRHIVNNGFEALIEIPLEDPGFPRVYTPEYAIFAHFRDSEVTSRLDQYFRQLPRASGVITNRGGLITTDHRIMPIILNYIKNRNMYFIDDRPIETSIAYSLAQQIMLPSFQKSITFHPAQYIGDTTNSRLTNDLGQLRDNPIIVTLQNPDQQTYDFLHDLIIVAQRIGYQLVRISDL